MTTPNVTDFLCLRMLVSPGTDLHRLLAAYDAQSTELKAKTALLSSTQAEFRRTAKNDFAEYSELSTQYQVLRAAEQTRTEQRDRAETACARLETQRNELRAELQVARGQLCRYEQPLRDEISRLNGVVRQLEGFNDELMIVAETPKPAGVPEEVLIYLRARGGGGRAKQLLQKYDFELRAKRIQELRRELTTLEGEN